MTELATDPLDRGSSQVDADIGLDSRDSGEDTGDRPWSPGRGSRKKPRSCRGPSLSPDEPAARPSGRQQNDLR